MKNLIFVLTGLIVGGGIVFFAMPPIQNSLLSGPVKYNCELSDGDFIDGECQCQLENGQTQEEMYDSSTGFCQSSVGGPAGEAFNRSIGLPGGYYSFWNNIVFGACTQSGGYISGAACICPTALEYNKDNGKCE